MAFKFASTVVCAVVAAACMTMSQVMSAPTAVESQLSARATVSDSNPRVSYIVSECILLGCRL